MGLSPFEKLYKRRAKWLRVKPIHLLSLLPIFKQYDCNAH